MNKKGESILGLMALMLVVFSFIIIQLQFNSIKETNDNIISVIGLSAEKMESLFNRPELVEYHAHRTSDHTHRYYDGRVFRRHMYQLDSRDIEIKGEK